MKNKGQVDFELQRSLEEAAASLREGEHPLSPFHWEIEFPEVFARENGGFDVFVGNPPFAGKNTLINGNRDGFLDWLKAIHEDSHGNADLVAHFFRRAFALLAPNGCYGLIATNTIGQGDTRSTGLQVIRKHNGIIYHVTRRLRWPGQAAVVVSVVHISKSTLQPPFTLDHKKVPLISAYLFHSGGDEDPARLIANDSKSFQGCIVLGMGFTFDDDDPDSANSLDDMKKLIQKDDRNSQRIFPYIGGQEVMESPTHSPSRFVVNFDDWPLRREDLSVSWTGSTEAQRKSFLRDGIVPSDYAGEVAEDYPDLVQLLRDKVKPDRDKQRDDYAKRNWWKFLRPRAEMQAAIRELDQVLLCSRIANAFAFTFMPSGIVLNEKLVVFPFSDFAHFSVIQSRTHEIWARFFSSTLKDDLQYTPSECFDTFPFPPDVDLAVSLNDRGKEFFEHRSRLMVSSDEGLTRTSNRFHDPDDTLSGIVKLRELHAAMDRAVLEAYSWHDLAKTATCEFLLDYEEDEDEEGSSSRRRKPWRYRWPDVFRDEVLARLLELNKQRHKEEVLAGLAADKSTKKKPQKSPRKKKASPDQQELF